MKKIIALILVGLITLVSYPKAAIAFCGFYVAKADAKLYNQASQVAIARDQNRTILTMANDYQGSLKDFALVVPVPVPITKEQVRVGDTKIMERLDAFSAPRLVQYFDPDPCQTPRYQERELQIEPTSLNRGVAKLSDRSLGVTVEAKFNVGEYSIIILSATQSNGLQIWLQRNGYNIPKAATNLLQPYIKQQMKFFVAKVNLSEIDRTQAKFLRPLQIAYESPKFMLPIRLGMLNSNGAQDLLIYILSPTGQAEITNYRTIKIPSNINIPVFVQPEFGKFYQAMFQKTYQTHGKKVAFLEYSWNMSNCDPCSAPILNPEELKQAGVFWLDKNPTVYITRLHVRYTRDKFPEDLVFQITGNQTDFQGRYIMQHPYKGAMNCSQADNYQKTLSARLETEATNLAQLTGWNLSQIRQKMDITIIAPKKPASFWENLWNFWQNFWN